MTSTRNGYSPRTSGSGESYRGWPLRYEVQQPSRFIGDIFPCTVFPRRFRISWSFVSILEITLLAVLAVAYLALSERVLKEMLPADDKRINELAEWMLRLFGSLLIMQVTFLLCGIAFGEVSARKIIYYGLLTGNILSVAMYAAFVHSMSEWNAINVSFVVVMSTFTMFRIIVLVLNPRWWVWKIRPLT
ncbi:uncharacterized protein LOC116303880 [Actinia tenebrosa]|uniref:Uncharacterized protein LOC116303880 n=1 Tax=Actinia tenebrosa TaxID=6105 RepID=A0A6P8IQY2_ACTTE|nr:uncharacterized protein LOC116303880 [Actinia tenebrosa]